MMLFCIRFSLIFLGLLCLIASKLFASPADTFGLSSKASATASLVTRSTPDPFGVYLNPSVVSGAQKLKLTLGILNTADFFHPIQNVVVQNALSGKSLERGNINTNYSNLTGINFGILIPFPNAPMKSTMGASGFLPFGSLASIQSSQQYVPLYDLFFARPKRFSLVTGFGFEPISNVSFGIGTNMYLTSGANTKINLNSTNSTVDLAMDIRPAIAPIVGTRVAFGNYQIGASYHASVNYAMILENHTDLVLFGSTTEGGDVSFPVMEFLARSSMFYDPQMVGMTVSRLFQNGLELMAGATWKNWSRYKTSMTHVEFTNPGGISASVPEVNFRDVISPSIGFEFPWNQWWMRGGYRFEPQHLKFQDDNSNFLDTDIQIVSLGFGKNIFGFDIDFHCQYHKLMDQKVIKDDPTQIGYSENGYTLGGSLINYGLTIGQSF